MKKSQILQEARKLVESSGQDDITHFVCKAIEHVPYKDFIDVDNKQFLISWVGLLISPHNVLDGWIISNNKGLLPRTNLRYSEQMKITRLEWMDWMIAHWEANND